MAMQGLAVVPLFAGYDMARARGRIFTYDVTGGHYEDTDHQATGSGGPRRPHAPSSSAGGRDLGRDEAVELAIQRPLRRGRRGLRHGRPGPGPRHLSRSWPWSTQQGYAEVPEDEVADAVRRADRAAGSAGGACAS